MLRGSQERLLLERTLTYLAILSFELYKFGKLTDHHYCIPFVHRWRTK